MTQRAMSSPSCAGVRTARSLRASRTSPECHTSATGASFRSPALQELLNSDATTYGGAGRGNYGSVEAVDAPWQPAGLVELTLPTSRRVDQILAVKGFRRRTTRRNGPRHSSVAPPLVGASVSCSSQYLDWHRATLELNCAGVPPDRLSDRLLRPLACLARLIRHWRASNVVVPDPVRRSRRTAAVLHRDDPDQDFESLDGAVGEALVSGARNATARGSSSSTQQSFDETVCAERQRQADLAAPHHAAHERRVRAPPRPCRPAPRSHRRQDRLLMPPPECLLYSPVRARSVRDRCARVRLARAVDVLVRACSEATSSAYVVRASEDSAMPPSSGVLAHDGGLHRVLGAGAIVKTPWFFSSTAASGGR